jgi:hypothetical protein
MAGHQETGDHYPTVVRINRRWRVIECSAHIQWILQARHGARWNSRYFCRTRAGLLACVREYAGEIEINAILLRLPKRFPEREP